MIILAQYKKSKFFGLTANKDLGGERKSTRLKWGIPMRTIPPVTKLGVPNDS
jgi:hypothetical protein